MFLFDTRFGQDLSSKSPSQLRYIFDFILLLYYYYLDIESLKFMVLFNLLIHCFLWDEHCIFYLLCLEFFVQRLHLESIKQKPLDHRKSFIKLYIQTRRPFIQSYTIMSRSIHTFCCSQKKFLFGKRFRFLKFFDYYIFKISFLKFEFW